MEKLVFFHYSFQKVKLQVFICLTLHKFGFQLIKPPKTVFQEIKYHIKPIKKTNQKTIFKTEMLIF